MFGTYGAWFSPQFDDDSRARYAAEAEELGYGTVWLGLGARSDSRLTALAKALAATERVKVATAIVNMWTNDAAEVAASYHALADVHGDRVVLGIGVGHPESIADYQSPYHKMVSYLDQLDEHGVPRQARILAALGDRSLRLAAQRALGAHPYLVVPGHTRHARDVVGPGVVVAPEHKVVVDDDPEAARSVGRRFVRDPYLGLRNYVHNLRRHGYSEQDVADGGSDRLIDDLVPHGTPEQIRTRLDEHLAAGADHVGIQVLPPSTGGDPMPGFRALAAVLFGHP